MALLVKNGGAWKTVKDIWVRETGVWKPVRRAFIRNAGAWKQAYQDEVVATISASAAQVTLPGPYFSAQDWADPSLTKRIIINNGAHLWSYSQGVPAFNLGSGRQGALYIDVAAGSYILGHNGSRNSGTGGTAIYARQANCFINNGGAGIYGGGGGGGVGGQGGPGFYDNSYTVYEGPAFDGTNYTYTWFTAEGRTRGRWGSTGDLFNIAGETATSISVGGWTYVRDAYQKNTAFETHYSIRREQGRSDRYYTSGGGGGTGGQGSGWNSGMGDVRENGFGGGGGGTNAGAGGVGGNGGGWGSNGGGGATGNGGNNGGGSGGAGGGAAGCFVDGNSFITWTAPGNRLGRAIN